ncbi:MAG: C10 family peptidase [Rikenellaceae bacterium]
MHVNWGQNEPYNMFSPGLKAGCGPVAIAQIMSMFQSVSSVSWRDGSDYGATILNWDGIIEDSCDNEGRLELDVAPESCNEVAHFLKLLSSVKQLLPYF